MDALYHNLSYELGSIACKRFHFHRFMAFVHQQLSRHSGHKNPLDRIAKQLRKDCQVLCFDEFFVSDIGDAMILAGLLKTLFKQGISLVATSNITIEDLYLNGLQRSRFLPAITLLQQHCDAIHLSGNKDHRLRQLDYEQTYFVAKQIKAKQLYQQLSQQKSKPEVVKICGRLLQTQACNGQVVWFDFNELCLGHRSHLDYIELADRFDTLILSNVPRLGGECRSWIKARGTEDGVVATQTGERKLNYAPEDDAARRFISLIDECYERKTILYLTAAVPLEQLYQGGALSFEFKRSQSRLFEMQSKQYLKQV